MDFQVEYAYAAPADVVFAMLGDPEFLRARFEATGALEYDVVECASTPDGGFRIVTSRTVEAEIPSFARKVLKPTNSMVQTEDWDAVSDGTRSGTWRIEPKGVPVSSSGTTRLVPGDATAVHHIEGRIKVSVPLIGGRLEHFVHDQAKKTLDAEHEFGQQWLAQRSS